MDLSKDDRAVISLALETYAHSMWKMAADRLPTFPEDADNYSASARKAETLAERVRREG